MSPLFVICALLVSEASSAVIFDPPPSNCTVLEGGTATFTCVPKDDGSSIFTIWIISPIGSAAVTVMSGNLTTLQGSDQVIQSTNRTQLTITGVQRSLDGASVLCRGTSQATGQVSAPLVYIVVQRPPNFTLPELARDMLEEQALSLTLENVDFGNSEGAVSVLFEGRVLTEGNGFTVSRSGSTWSLEFPALNRSHAGVYRVLLSNTVGSSGMNFTVNVVYPPEFTFPTVRSVQLNSRSQFTFDCRASAAKPSSVDYSFRKDGSSQPFSESGPVLTIAAVVRANTGNYSCTANNTVGSSITVYHNLLVVAPPTFPLNLMVSGEMAFSAMVTWTPPTDDGGISHPSWTPPSPSSSPIIQYTVTYSNSSGSWSINNLNTSQVTLSNLQHSTDYTVTVAASNAHGQSTGIQGTFRTLDSKPILQAVVLAPLSLNNFTANVTFLTVGGQNVTNFSITINDSSPTVIDSTPVPDGKGVLVSLLIEGRSFTKGTYYTVEITATSSVGTSEPITGLIFVPNPPVITSNFTEVSADDIPSTKCCAGVQLRLAEQPDVSDLKVLLTPQGGSQFTVNPADLSLEGFTLYIGGVQAGTDYTAVVTVSNILGSSDDQLQLKPLLGVPSNPNPPTVSVNGAGQVTVELSTAYPGTVQTRSGSMFRFEIQFIEEEQRSTRQSKTEIQAAIPASLFNTSAIFTTNLDPGSYSVSVTAVNEQERSSAVMSQSTFTVTALPIPAPVSTTIIVAAVIVVTILTILITIILCIICFITAKKKRGTAKLGGKKSQTEPVYDELETDLHAGTLVEMRSNPAYDTAESVTTTDKPIPGPIGPADYEIAIVHSTAVGDSDVVLLENMAYGVIEDVKLPPTTTTTTPSAAPPTQSTPGGLESEYEVMYVKGAGSEEENYI